MSIQDVKHWIRTELWDQVPVSICVIDNHHNIVDANSTFSKNYGVWNNRLCYEVYKGGTEPCKHCAAVKTFGDGKVRVREEKGVVHDGRAIDYLVQMVPLVRPDGTIRYIIEMSTDITETKLLDKEKLEAERLAAVGQTVAGLAHGIKNVLMGLQGGMYVVRSGMQKGDGERVVQGWHMLEEDINRIATYVKGFLEFARGRTPQVHLVDPNRIAKKVIDRFQHKAKRAGIELLADLQPGIPYALMDEEGIHECLSNLVSNAMDACQISDKSGRHATLSTWDRDGVLVFEVADDGTGIDYEIKKNIFTNFFSTKGSDKGTGLGLLTTRKIVQEHGGKVSFESTKGEGALFRLEFPRDRLPQPGGDKESKS